MRRKHVKNGFDKWSDEFWTMPAKDKPITTQQASIRNFVHNVTSIPSDIKKITKTITDAYPNRSFRGRRRKL